MSEGPVDVYESLNRGKTVIIHSRDHDYTFTRTPGSPIGVNNYQIWGLSVQTSDPRVKTKQNCRLWRNVHYSEYVEIDGLPIEVQALMINPN